MTEPMRYAEIQAGEVVHVCEVYRADDTHAPALSQVSKGTPAGRTLKTIPDGVPVEPGWTVEAGQFVEPAPEPEPAA